MTAYDWPRPGRQQRHDDQRARRAFNAGRGTFAGGTIAEPAADVGVRAAPSAAADLWAPIGPSVVIGSDETGSPRVTGRVSDVWVEPVGGRRAYAAAANGGVWYTDDARHVVARPRRLALGRSEGGLAVRVPARQRLPAGRVPRRPEGRRGLGRHR